MKALVCLYQCFWCDRTTKDSRKVRVDRKTGRLICRDCSAHNRATGTTNVSGR